MKVFVSSWCASCTAVKEFLSTNIVPTGTVIIVDIDREPEKLGQYNLKQIPCLLKDDGTLMYESLDIIEYIKESL